MNTGEVLTEAQKWLNRQFRKTLIWLAFAVGFAVLPIALEFLRGFLAGIEVTPLEAYGHGEGFIIMAAIAGEALARIITTVFNRPHGRNIGTPMLMLMLFCGSIALISAVAYGMSITAASLRSPAIVTATNIGLVVTLASGFGVILNTED